MPRLVAQACDFKELAASLDSAGWQQFSFVKAEDHATVLAGIELVPLPSEHRLLLVTHSCDVVHHTEQEQFVEFLAIERVPTATAEDLSKQSPRLKFLAAYAKGDPEPVWFQAKASLRLSVPRDRLRTLSPDLCMSLRAPGDNEGLRGEFEEEVADWLASRYNRSWTPTEFDRRLSRNVAKIQSSLVRLAANGVQDIYARVTPSAELDPNEAYEIDLVILVDPEQEGRLGAVRSEAETLARAVAQPGAISMVRAPHVQLSTQYGHGYLRGWMQFQYVFRDSMAFRTSNRR